jgi:hypothetical protein
MFMRTVGLGGKRYADDAATPSFQSRSGVRSSRIQKPRPCVATTRSPSLTARSVIGAAGRLRWKACQLAPSSKDTYSPVSVPA